MYLHVLACDYDGTIAAGGHVAPATAQALARVRESGRRVLLVTGRMLPDLRSVCPDADRMFDAIVAENGGLAYFPDRREVRTLGLPPEPALIDALRARSVPLTIGTSIVATTKPWAPAALAAIRETGVERTLVFNKGSLMLVPGGVTKGTGLSAALTALGLSTHNVIAVGDAENDHAFLALAECAVAVADAIPALRERADVVTREPNGRGVVEVVDEYVLRDGAALLPLIPRHRLVLGKDAAGAEVTIGAHGTRLLIVGPSASGTSTLTGVLVERLVESGRNMLILDPAGDHQTLAELEHVVVLGGQAAPALPSTDDIEQLLRHPATSVVLNLSAMTRAEKLGYAATVLGAAASVRSRTGLPHWVIIDEAHHILPPEGSSGTAMLRSLGGEVCLITLGANGLAPEVLPYATAIASTDLEAFVATTRAAIEGRAVVLPPFDTAPLERGELVFAELGSSPSTTRFSVARRTGATCAPPS